MQAAWNMLNVQDIFKQPYFMPHWERAGCFFLMPKTACTFYQSIPIYGDFSIDAPEHENSLPNPGKLVILTLFLSQYLTIRAA